MLYDKFNAERPNNECERIRHPFYIMFLSLYIFQKYFFDRMKRGDIFGGFEVRR